MLTLYTLSQPIQGLPVSSGPPHQDINLYRKGARTSDVAACGGNVGVNVFLSYIALLGLLYRFVDEGIERGRQSLYEAPVDIELGSVVSYDKFRWLRR